MRPPDLSPDALWKQRYRITTTRAYPARSAPDRGLAISNRSGVFQLYAWDVASGGLRQITDRPTGQIRGSLSNDGRFIYYLQDERGDEIGHYVRVPFEGGPPEDITPDLPPYSSFGITSSPDGRALGFVVADARGFHVFVQDVAPDGALGPPRQIFTSAQFTVDLHFSQDAALLAVSTTEGRGGLNFATLVLDTRSGARAGVLEDGLETSVTARIFAPGPGDTRMLAVSNAGGANRPLIWDPRTGERTDLSLGDMSGDFEPLDWSPDGSEILLLRIDQATTRLYRYHLTDGSLSALDDLGGTYESAYYRPDGGIFAHWQSATRPLALVELDRAGALQRTVLETGAPPPARPWRSVSFPSSDGTLIQGWLALPEGQGPFPTILETHGGPTAVMTEIFHRGAQCWLDHGYAFLTINYRGSTTFGRAFEQQIIGDIGRWETEDLVAAHAWLLREGIADPQAILLTGWSYGGYLTLLGLGRRPELWAGGMAGIAIADWSVQYEDTADTLRGYQVALFGGTPEQRPELYAAASPISYVEQVAAPVLVIQGSNDTRCPARPMRMYQQRMRDLGKPIEVVWFEAGHGSYVVEQSIAHQELMLRFAYQVLG